VNDSVTRVLQLIKGLDRGGAERLLVDALRYRDTNAFDHEVAYISHGHGAMLPSIEELGIPTHCLEGDRGPAWIGRLRSLVAERSIDVVHVHSPYAAIGARLAWRRTEHPRIVYTEHNMWESYHPATRWGNLLTFPRNDFVFAVSEHVRGSIRYPAPLSRRRMPQVETLLHGIDRLAIMRQATLDGVREEFGIESDAPVIGCVANFRPQKAHSVLLDATLLIRRSVPNVRLVLVGGGHLENDIRRLVHRMGLDPTVVFTGTRSDAPRIAGCFDVFVLSSVIEGLSIALIEAMALGKPAVVTDAGGLPEAVPNGGGIVVPAGDHRKLAEAVTGLLVDPDLRRGMGEVARHWAAEFDVRKTARRLEEVYSQVMA
jgi:glycosyltransferase involved in cell wall biosynthesis